MLTIWTLWCFIVAWPMIKATLGTAPWRMFGSVERRRDYWRNVALVMIRTGGHWFSIRHLQYLMPNDREACRIWGFLNGTSVTSEEVEMLRNTEENTAATTERNPWLHWIGPTPLRVSGGSSRNNRTRRGASQSKIVLYIHGTQVALWMRRREVNNNCRRRIRATTFQR